MKHIPVLVQEVLRVFEEKRLSTFFDGTLGAGGHAKAILTAHPEITCYFGCDRDPSAQKMAAQTLEPFQSKLVLLSGSYARLLAEVKEKVDGILLDLGVSSMQLDERERGFSFLGNAPLDMRMDPTGELTAEEVVNYYSEKELARLFFEYGEERRARKVAKAIVEARKKRRLKTTQELVDIVKRAVLRGKLHPATRIFQALRIEVNDELGQLKKGLEVAREKLSPGGRIAVISFHSLEDGIVKRSFREEDWIILTKKPITPTAEEIRLNPRARSAKLRAGEKGHVA